MSSQEFVETLRRLGYPKADQLDAESLEWMFENEAVSPLLEWLSDNLQEDNILSSAEIREYEELKRTEGGVLEGRQLEEALQNVSISEYEETSEDRLRDEIAMLKEEIKYASKQKDRLVQQRNKLSLHQTSLSDRLSSLGEIEKQAKQNYQTALEQCHADNTQMDKCLESLAQAVRDLSALYTCLQGSGEQTQGTTPEQTPFLSQLSLNKYYGMEQKYSHEVKAFTQKQFFQGISEMAGQRDGTRYEFLEISHPESLLVKGESAEVKEADCAELARLQEVYPVSESKRVAASVEQASVVAMCESATEQLRELRQDTSVPDVNKLSRDFQSAQSMLSPLRREVAQLSESEIPALINQNAISRLTPILRGDYNLKLSRQSYLTSNQDKVIDHLIGQRARCEFLTMAYEIESRNHRECHRLLLAISTQLQKNIKLLEDKMKLLVDPALSPIHHQRETVDTRDKFITGLYHIIGQEMDEDKKQIFITYKSLLEGASRLGQHLSTLEDSLSSSASGQDGRLRNLEKNLESCENLVYAGSSTTSGQPQLTPRQLQDSLTQLDTITKKLEVTIKNVLKVVDAKKRSLQSDRFLATERDMFPYFFNDPGQLRAALDEVTTQLNAQNVK